MSEISENARCKRTRASLQDHEKPITYHIPGEQHQWEFSGHLRDPKIIPPIESHCYGLLEDRLTYRFAP